MKNLFEKGLSYRSFIMNQPRDIRIKFTQNYITMNLGNEYRNLINSRTDRIKILGIVEGNCIDSQIYLPVLERLISTNNNIELRLVTADYLKEEHSEYRKLKLPIFIFMDAEYNIKGQFVEKPKASSSGEPVQAAAEEMVNYIIATVKQ